MLLDTFLNSQTSPFRSGWLRLPSPPSLSQVVMWGMKQARGLVTGSDIDSLAGSGTLQTSELVLVDNVKVLIFPYKINCINTDFILLASSRQAYKGGCWSS